MVDPTYLTLGGVLSAHYVPAPLCLFDCRQQFDYKTSTVLSRECDARYAQFCTCFCNHTQIILFQSNNFPNYDLVIQFKSSFSIIFFSFSIILLKELIPIKFKYFYNTVSL